MPTISLLLRSPLRRALAHLAPALALLVAGCASLDDAPINRATDGAGQPPTMAALFPDDGDGETLVGLTFSGGGTRAAAFSFGVLQAFAETDLAGPGGRSAKLIDRVDFVSGVSGGSVTAAYFGLKGRDALADFREKFLLRNAEEDLNDNPLNPGTLMRVYAGGANDRSNLPRWLDRNLFHGATFARLLEKKRPTVWLNASDIANHSPFVFEPDTFRSFCSDLATLPISEAVAASAAVPVIFAPVSLETFPERCAWEMPRWARYASEHAAAPALLKANARALAAYRDPAKMKYIRLLDGGLTDNFGLSGLTIARAAADAPHAPLSPRQAARLKRAMFLVVNSGRASETDWARTRQGPTVTPLLMAVIDTGIDASVRQGFDAFQLTIARWQQDLVEWRCKLTPAEVTRYVGTTKGWNCRDVKMLSGEVAFDQLPDRRDKLQKIATRFVLPPEEVDLLIGAGRDATLANPVFNGFLRATRPPGAAAARRTLTPERGPARMLTPTN
ncbi:patatin-like phospholipase family protein [Pinisolibacter sp.]|uniref:patatin-like phospholipase family protein n=1 Tax=Pinisolibacter sp. TaxID=2172024 RepID=UPI002FDE55B1